MLKNFIYQSIFDQGFDSIIALCISAMFCQEIRTIRNMANGRKLLL